MRPNEPTVRMAVRCPADRGDPSYDGMVLGVGDRIQRNSVGEPYRWVTVRRRDTGTNHVWPSNRLERI